MDVVGRTGWSSSIGVFEATAAGQAEACCAFQRSRWNVHALFRRAVLEVGSRC
jgi:hypothetical protein